MLKAVIIEDETGSAKLLSNLLKEYCSGIELTGIAYTVDEGVKLIHAHKPDVVFLDIEIGNESGFDLLDKFTEIDFEIIFTTAYEQYALKAIKACAIDYLLKPIDVDELKAAVEKVNQQSLQKFQSQKFEAFKSNLLSEEKNNFRMVLPSVKGASIIAVSEIIYLQSDRQYTVFVLKNGNRIMTSKNLGEYEIYLSEHNFIRSHHSFLINLNEVKEFSRNLGYRALMSNGDWVDVSKRKKELFLKKLGTLK